MALAEFEASSDQSNDRNARNGTMAASRADLTSDDVAYLTNVGGMLRRWREVEHVVHVVRLERVIALASMGSKHVIQGVPCEVV